MQSTGPGITALHILVIEATDEEFEFIERELQRVGLSFSSTRIAAPEVLTQPFDREPPHLVLCAHGITRLNSFSVLEAVRARSPSLPFIVVAGSLPDEQIADAYTRGADDLVQTNRLGDLGPAVQRALRLGEMRRRLVDAEKERDRLRAEFEAWRLGRPRLPTPLLICASCKKIHDQKDGWIQAESYLHDHFNLRFSHGLCLPCANQFTASIK